MRRSNDKILRTLTRCLSGKSYGRSYGGSYGGLFLMALILLVRCAIDYIGWSEGYNNLKAKA
ncbi:hypothetical protein K439DRAFT_1629424 [Ramaria rubella]|nr:hypothetical protein K439DRAFT_1629424 [Ramaria rubella]